MENKFPEWILCLMRSNFRIELEEKRQSNKWEIKDGGGRHGSNVQPVRTRTWYEEEDD
jgi:hypothetical protein